MSVKPLFHTLTKHGMKFPPVLHKRPTQGTVDQPHYVEMPSQGIMSNNVAGNNPALHPVERQFPGISSRTKAQINFLACL
jgi:hypothetical protein